MLDIFSLIQSLDGEITQQVRRKLKQDVKLYFLLSRCCKRIHDSHQRLKKVLSETQIENAIQGKATTLVANFLSRQKVLDNLIEDLKIQENQACKFLYMIKSEIITGAVRDERCVFSFLCIADNFKRSLCDWDALMQKINKTCSKLLQILGEIQEVCESSEDI